MSSLSPHIPDDLLPTGTNAYIAGGYAACSSRASDIDLWVRAPTMDELPLFRQQLIDHLTESRFAFTLLEDRREYKDDYGEFVGGVMKVAKVPYAPYPIHIMVTDMAPEDLLNTFDISTHMAAFDGTNRITIPKWSPLSDEPYAWKNTPTTPERLEKIRNRYADLRTNGKING